jgi:hypothetical protein
LRPFRVAGPSPERGKNYYPGLGKSSNFACRKKSPFP